MMDINCLWRWVRPFYLNLIICQGPLTVDKVQILLGYLSFNSGTVDTA